MAFRQTRPPRVIDKIRDDLAYRLPSGPPLAYIVLPREEAERLVTEWDELAAGAGGQDSRLPLFAVAGILVIATLALSAYLILHAYGGGLELSSVTICQTYKRDNAYWSWREIDGRKCWYRGARNKPKSELRWSAPASYPGEERRPTAVERPGAGDSHDGSGPASTREEVVQDGGSGAGSRGQHNESPASSGARALSADDLLAYTCCWPDLAELEAENIGLRKPPREPFEVITITPPSRPDNTWAWLWALTVPIGYMVWVALRRAIQKRTPESVRGPSLPREVGRSGRPVLPRRERLGT